MLLLALLLARKINFYFYNNNWKPLTRRIILWPKLQGIKRSTAAEHNNVRDVKINKIKSSDLGLLICLD